MLAVAFSVPTRVAPKTPRRPIVRVALGPRPATHVSPMQGDYFGETALVQKAPRNASVVAVGEVRLRVLSRDQFEEFDLHRKLQLEVSDSAESGFLIFLISDLILQKYLSNCLAAEMCCSRLHNWETQFSKSPIKLRTYQHEERAPRTSWRLGHHENFLQSDAINWCLLSDSCADFFESGGVGWFGRDLFLHHHPHDRDLADFGLALLLVRRSQMQNRLVGGPLSSWRTMQHKEEGIGFRTQKKTCGCSTNNLLF